MRRKRRNLANIATDTLLAMKRPCASDTASRLAFRHDFSGGVCSEATASALLLGGWNVRHRLGALRYLFLIQKRGDMDNAGNVTV